MVELGALEGGEEGDRCFNGERLGVFRGAGVWGKRVGPGVEHALREVGVVGVGGHTEVAEHGVGFPAAQELDGFGVDVSTEQGSGSAGA